jgi:NhaP-type Na+/H+ or K+/H+ antiporter
MKLALASCLCFAALAYASIPLDDQPSLVQSADSDSTGRQLLSSGSSSSSSCNSVAGTTGTHRRSMDPRRSGNFQYYSLLFPFCCLAVGFVVNVLTKALIPWMPYTVMMMIVGLLVGLLHRGTQEGLGVLSDSISSWDDIDPHLLMYAFLPPLLFGDSMNLNYHHVKQCFWQCFLLAGPGVVIGTGLMGLVAKWVLPYSWDWKMAMCFASITAATDPVAVVGLLNQLGASKKLTMVIAGESLMNDGIAIVAFTLFKNLLHGQSYDFWGVVEFFFQVALGGPAVGLAFGIVTLFVLTVIKNSTEGSASNNLSNQTTLTFVVAYLSFFVGEEVCEVSGVLACVTCGVAIAAFGWPLLSAQHEIHHVWHVVEFMGNTIVFMLSGIIIASDIYTEYDVDKHRTQKYFGYMIVVYLFMVIIRGTVVLILYPALDNIGYKLERTWRDALVAVWGGLRGAVGLVLCLIIDEDSTICNEGAPFVVLIGGATFYTLVINGVTTGPLLKALKMLKDEEAQKFLDFNVLRSIHKKVKAKFDNLSESTEHKQAIPAAAMTLIEILGDTWTKTNEAGKERIIKSLNKLRNDSSVTDPEEICHFTRVFRDLYLEMVRSEYWQMIEKQLVPITSSVPEILLGSIDIGLDEDDKSLADWRAVEERLEIQWYHKHFDESRFAQVVMHQFGRLVARDRNAHVLDSYICAHEHAWEKFKVTMTEFEQLCKSKTLMEKCGDGQTIGEELAKAIQCAREKIRVPNEENLKECRARIDALEEDKNNSNLMRVLCTKRLAGEVLHFQQTQLDSLMDSAVLSSKGYERLVGQIEQNIYRLQNENIDQTSHDTEFESHSQSNIAVVLQNPSHDNDTVATTQM